MSGPFNIRPEGYPFVKAADNIKIKAEEQDTRLRTENDIKADYEADHEQARVLLWAVRDTCDNMQPPAAARWRSAPHVLASFCVGAMRNIMIDGRAPVAWPASLNPYEFTPECVWRPPQDGRSDHPATDAFRDMFSAARQLRTMGRPALRDALVEADFVTDSVTMTRLFHIATAIPRLKQPHVYVPKLKLVVQYVAGKIFMKAHHSPNDSCPVRRDATGQLVAPRHRFCTRWEEKGAKSYQRSTAYKIRFAPDDRDCLCRIVVHDDDLVGAVPEPGKGPFACDGKCTNHGLTNRDAVPMVHKADPPLTSQDSMQDYIGKMEPFICARPYFAGTAHVVHFQYAADPGPANPAPVIRPLCQSSTSPEVFDNWAQDYNIVLWYLSMILILVQTEAQQLSRNPRHGCGCQLLVDAQGDNAANYALVFTARRMEPLVS